MREKGKNETKRTEHDDSSWTWLYMAVRFGLRDSDTHLTDSSIAQSQHPARFKASRDFARSSLRRVVGDGADHTYYTYICTFCIHVVACVSLCTYQTWYGLRQTNFIEMFCSLLTYFQYRENSRVNKKTTRGKCAHCAAARGLGQRASNLFSVLNWLPASWSVLFRYLSLWPYKKGMPE